MRLSTLQNSFNMNTIPFATDEEIKMVHNVLLKGKPDFDKQRVDIIKDNGSCYVQACPGSGKTTVLLAKLIILANRMPLPDGKGICVLTHTNVAIDEIKAKLGQKADILFSYPNFFGTIQTFLHKFVTTAALHNLYGSQITYVDDEIAKAVLLKKYESLPWNSVLKKYIYSKIVNRKHYISIEEVECLGGETLLISLNIVKVTGKKVKKYDFQLKGYDTRKINEPFRSKIKLKRDSIKEKEEKDIFLNIRFDYIDNCLILNSTKISLQAVSAAEYISLKKSMFEEGVMSFQDAYDLAFHYIEKNQLNFSSFSDKRFQYLFIDEVQDCDKQQVELLKKLFDEKKLVVQRFGDYRQAIFSDYTNNEIDETSNNDLKKEELRHIYNSNRFGENIAKPLRTICMEDNHLLQGNENVPSVKSIIIIYDDPLKVLPKYVELLKTTRVPELGNCSVLDIAKIKRNQDPLHRINIKACGWVGNKQATEKKRFLESYFPMYEKNNVKSKVESESFNDFINSNQNCMVKDCVSVFIQGILKFLDLCDIKYQGNRRYTRMTFLDFLSSHSIEVKTEFLNNVVGWTTEFTSCCDEKYLQNVKDRIFQYLTTTILPLFGKEVSVYAKSFFYSPSKGSKDIVHNHHGNIFHDEENDIDIEITTVHAVKGETHVSTLYLETFYNKKHESERLSAQFQGTPYTEKTPDIVRSLKVAYVGMSRPRVLLCAAIQKDRFNNIDCSKLRETWDVVEA